MRIAIGQKDMQNQTMEVARRDTGAKEFVPWNQVSEHIPRLLELVQVFASFLQQKETLNTPVAPACIFDTSL